MNSSKENEIMIVNSKDKIIAYKKRDTLTQNDTYRVSSLWIENSKGRVLLAKRAMTKIKSPGKWVPPVNGTVERGETYESNIIKEAEEEIGLKNYIPKILGKVKAEGKSNCFVKIFFLLSDKEIKDYDFDTREISELKWFSREQIVKLASKHPEKFSSVMMECLDLSEYISTKRKNKENRYSALSSP